MEIKIRYIKVNIYYIDENNSRFNTGLQKALEIVVFG